MPIDQTEAFLLYVDGEFRSGATGAMADSLDPATGEPWTQFPMAGTEDVNAAVAAAKRALDDEAWRGLSASARGKLLYRLADLVERDAAVLGEIETRDSGKLAVETRTQTAYVADYYRYFAGLADKIEGAVLPIDKPDLHVFTTPMPIGVVVAVVPWNAQMFLTATKLGPALAAGYTIVIKASEVAPCAMLAFARLIDEAGFPPGVVSVITGDAANCAVPLTTHPDVDRIAFTGGPETARHVVRNSAENFAVTTLELGGKSPILVFDDADLDSAVNGLIAGNFGASGQSCVAGSRGLIQRSVLPDVIERIKAKAAAITVGPPLDPATHVGPLCTQAQVDRIEDTLARAQQQGATVHLGGQRPSGLPGFPSYVYSICLKLTELMSHYTETICFKYQRILSHRF